MYYYFRLHHYIHSVLKMRAYCYRRSSVVGVSVCLLITFVRPPKMVEPIEMPVER